MFSFRDVTLPNGTQLKFKVRRWCFLGASQCVICSELAAALLGVRLTVQAAVQAGVRTMRCCMLLSALPQPRFIRSACKCAGNQPAAN